MKTQIENSEADQKRRRLIELFARVQPSCLDVDVADRNPQPRQSTMSSSRESTESASEENYELHHATIPDRQGPTDSVSPNHYGNRSRSHNDKSDKV